MPMPDMATLPSFSVKLTHQPPSPLICVSGYHLKCFLHHVCLISSSTIPSWASIIARPWHFGHVQYLPEALTIRDHYTMSRYRMDEKIALRRIEADLHQEMGDSTLFKAAKEGLQNHREVLERLRAWRDWDKIKAVKVLSNNFCSAYYIPSILSGHPVHPAKNCNPWRSISSHPVLC